MTMVTLPSGEQLYGMDAWPIIEAFRERDALREIIELMCLDAEAMPNVRDMIEGAWLAGYYHAGYTHDSAYAFQQATKCADEFLGKEGAT